MNYYSYAQNNPANWSDPSGNCPLCGLMAAGAVLGGFAGFTGSVIAQTGVGIRSGKSWQDSLASVNLGDAFIAGGVGAVAGALAPVAALSPGVAGVAGQAMVGFFAGAAQYDITQSVHKQPVEPGSMLASSVMGAAGVGVAGFLPTASATLPLRPALEELWVDQANSMLSRVGFARLIGGGTTAAIDLGNLLSPSAQGLRARHKITVSS
ncbi:MAG: hypothetical protein M1389_09245 [Chloroflexi bacterium]|nr:hypothetical protein [Chloroflexota bacterium]